jgi:hypothetical protein
VKTISEAPTMQIRPPRRQRALALVRAQLARKGSPYFVLFIVLAATGVAGFWASVVLRWAGLHSMAIRYPLCVAVAYFVFLFLLFLYVWFHRKRRHVSIPAGGIDNVDMAVDVVDAGTDLAVAVDATADFVPGTAAAVNSSNKGGGWLGKLGGDGGGDGGGDAGAIIVLLVIVLLVGAAMAAGVVVLVEAPVLLAEVLVDGVVLAGMARRLRKTTPGDWLGSVVRRTLMPALVVAVIFAVGGVILGQLTPTATTMGEALMR